MYASIPVKDLQESLAFYGNILGLNIVDQNPNGVWLESGQTRVALCESVAAGTNQATAAIFEVLEPEPIVKELQKKGVRFEAYNLPGFKRKGVMHVMGNFRAAWFRDPSGNLIAIGTHL